MSDNKTLNVKLGELADNGQMDAIHMAVIPVISEEKIYPGSPLIIDCAVDGTLVVSSTKPWREYVGIADPFYLDNIMPGEKFWMMVKPGTVCNLRHTWEHHEIQKYLDGSTKKTNINYDEKDVDDIFGKLLNDESSNKAKKENEKYESKEWLTDFAASIHMDVDHFIETMQEDCPCFGGWDSGFDDDGYMCGEDQMEIVQDNLSTIIHHMNRLGHEVSAEYVRCAC